MYGPHLHHRLLSVRETDGLISRAHHDTDSPQDSLVLAEREDKHHRISFSCNGPRPRLMASVGRGRQYARAADADACCCDETSDISSFSKTVHVTKQTE